MLTSSTNKLAALISYTEEQSTSYARSHSYAIHIFTTSASSTAVQTTRIVPVKYTSVSLGICLSVTKLTSSILTPALSMSHGSSFQLAVQRLSSASVMK